MQQHSMQQSGIQTPCNSPAIGGMAGGKRCKAYAAPKGVWKNNGGFNATIYVHKRRIYGPIRRDLQDAIDDRREMEEALKDLMNGAIAENPQALEYEMREVVGKLRNKVRVKVEGDFSYPEPEGSILMGGFGDDEFALFGRGETDSGLYSAAPEPHVDSEHFRKRQRVGSGFSALGSPQNSPCLNWGGLEFGGDTLVLGEGRFDEPRDWNDSARADWTTSWGSDDFVATRH